MPRTPRRRSTPRRLPPRPTYAGAPREETPTPRSARDRQPQEYVEREAPYFRHELLRVAGVSAVCFGLLAVLAVIDRLQ